MEQRAKQLMCWFEPFVKLRTPKMFNLRQDPFERADENSNRVIDHGGFLSRSALWLPPYPPFAIRGDRLSWMAPPGR